MNKQEVYQFLSDKQIHYEVTEHQAVFNMEELKDIELPYKEYDAKNLFVRDDKKQQYYLISVKGDKKVDLKEFRMKNHTRPLSFASADDLLRILKLTPGSVTPLGLLNDEEHKVMFYLDEDFMKEPYMIGCHPNDNTATVWLKIQDLIKIIQEKGNIIKFFNV